MKHHVEKHIFMLFSNNYIPKLKISRKQLYSYINSLVFVVNNFEIWEENFPAKFENSEFIALTMRGRHDYDSHKSTSIECARYPDHGWNCPEIMHI